MKKGAHARGVRLRALAISRGGGWGWGWGRTAGVLSLDSLRSARCSYRRTGLGGAGSRLAELVLTSIPGVCVARLRGGGWGRTVSAPRGAVAPFGPFVHLALVPRCWVDDLGSVRCPQPVSHLVQFMLKSGDLLCGSGGSGVGGGGGGGGGGGHFSELLLEPGDGGGGSFGCGGGGTS